MVRRFDLRKGSAGVLGRFVLFVLLAGLLVCNGCDLLDDEENFSVGSEKADADYSGTYSVQSESGGSQTNIVYAPGTNPPHTEVWTTNIEYDVTSLTDCFGVSRIVLYHQKHENGPSAVTATDDRGNGYSGAIGGNRMVLSGYGTITGTFSGTSSFSGTWRVGGDTRKMRLTK